MSISKPWLSIWLKPRQTVRWIMETDQAPLIFILIKGFLFNLNFSMNMSFGDNRSLLTILGMSLLLSLPTGILLVEIWSWSLTWIGKWLGGIGDKEDIKKAFVWSGIFDSIGLVLYFIQIGLMGNAFFQSDASKNISGIAFGVSLLEMLLYVWWVAYLIVALSELHSFSKWKGFFTWVLLMLIVVILLLLILMI
jgi:hypothetical protein